jgi:hypothetical protein
VVRIHPAVPIKSMAYWKINRSGCVVINFVGNDSDHGSSSGNTVMIFHRLGLGVDRVDKAEGRLNDWDRRQPRILHDLMVSIGFFRRCLQASRIGGAPAVVCTFWTPALDRRSRFTN